MQAETVHDDRQYGGEDETTGGGHVSLGHVLVAFDHMVQIHQVAARHLQQAANPVDFRRSAATPHEEALGRANDRKGQGGEEQDGEEGIEHDGSWRTHRNAAQSRRSGFSRDAAGFPSDIASRLKPLLHESGPRQKSLHRRKAS